jgi:hypothetical protein
MMPIIRNVWRCILLWTWKLLISRMELEGAGKGSARHESIGLAFTRFIVVVIISHSWRED